MMKTVDCWKALFGEASLNAYRALRFFYTMYQNNQEFTMFSNRVGKPSLQDYEYLPGKHISKNGVRYLNKRFKKYGAFVVVGRYYVEKFGIYCSVLKVKPEFGLFLTLILQSLQNYDRQISEIRAKQEVRW